MIRVLIAKDLSRTRRNPLPWVINLLVPLCIVALIGVIFGGGNKDQELGQVRFAFVDEDRSRLIEVLRGSLNQGQAREHFDPVFLDRAPALALLNNNELSAVVIVPKDFTKNFLGGAKAQLELVKNPAQSIQPAVLEELLGVLTAGLNAVSHNLGEELPAVRTALEGEIGYREVAQFVIRFGDRIEAIRKLRGFPLAGYEEEVRPGNAKPGGSGGPGFNLFGYLLAGMASMFLLFLANTGMSDLHREVQLRTLERYAAHHVAMMPFIVAKVAYVVAMLLLCAVVLFGGGGLAFGIVWPHPAELAALVLAYTLFAAGLMAALVALLPDQRKSDTVVSMLTMGMALAGGCMFPPQQLPPFVVKHVSPLLPTAWFAEGVRTVEFAAGTTAWVPAAVKLGVVGFLLMVVAALMFRRRLAKGLRA